MMPAGEHYIKMSLLKERVFYTIRMSCVGTLNCLKKIPNRFQMVLVAAYRARHLTQGYAPKVEAKDKPAVVALREIAKGEVGLEMLKRVP